MLFFCAVLFVSWEFVYGLENESIFLYKAESPPIGKKPFVINVPDSYPEESTVEEFPWQGVLLQPSTRKEPPSDEVEIVKSIELDFKDNSDNSGQNITGGESVHNLPKAIVNKSTHGTTVKEIPFGISRDMPFGSTEAFLPTPPPDDSHSITHRKEIVLRSTPDQFSNNFDFESRLLLGTTLLRKDGNNAHTQYHGEKTLSNDRSEFYFQPREHYYNVNAHVSGRDDKARTKYYVATSKSDDMNEQHSQLQDNYSNDNTRIIDYSEEDSGGKPNLEERDKLDDDNNSSKLNYQPQEIYSDVNAQPDVNIPLKKNDVPGKSRLLPRSKSRYRLNNTNIPYQDNIKTELTVKSQPMYIITDIDEQQKLNNTLIDKQQNGYDLHPNILVKRKRKERPTITHWDFGKKTHNFTQRNVMRQQSKSTINSPEAQKSIKYYTYSNVQAYPDVEQYPAKPERPRNEEIPVSSLNPLLHHREILKSYEESEASRKGQIVVPWNVQSASTPHTNTQVIFIQPYGTEQGPVLNPAENWHPVYIQEAYVPPYPIFLQQNGQLIPNIVPITLRHIQDPSVILPRTYVVDVKRKEPAAISEHRQ